MKIVHYTRCWGCMMGQHFDPPEWHSWADDEDIAHAVATGSRDATGRPDPDLSLQPCACRCAGVRDSHVEVHK